MAYRSHVKPPLPRRARAWRSRAAVAILLAGVSGGAAARAEEAPAGFWEQDRLLGDLGGLRSKLENAGVKLGLQETSEVWGNTSGGLHRGAVFDGAALATLTVDTGKAFGWEGGTFTASAYQIHGRGPSANLVGNLQSASGVEATRTTRLYDLWYEQALWDGRVSVRIGQMGADEEFLLSTTGALFINSTFGFPTLAASDLPSGGPAYPLATPGLRLKVKANDQITLLAAVFNGDPAGPGAGDSQARDAAGTAFRTGDGVLAFGEAQYAINQGEDDKGLPGTYRLGFWYHSHRFADQRFDTAGLSLANPASTGAARLESTNYSVYGVADQMVWRKDGTKDEGISVFARLMGAPGDRNLVDFYANGGVAWKGILPGRSQDTAGLGVGYVRIGANARGLASDTAFYIGAPFPARSSELVLEATYQVQLAGWWQLQPDLQYTIRPGGGIPDPNNPGRRLKDSLLIGLRSVIVF